MQKPESVDHYLQALEPEKRAALQNLRRIILDELPTVQEHISYGMPAYRLKRPVAYFAAFKNHCSFFPAGVPEGFEEELAPFKVSKGTIQFTPHNPIPEDLVRRLLRASAARS